MNYKIKLVYIFLIIPIGLIATIVLFNIIFDSKTNKLQTKQDNSYSNKSKSAVSSQLTPKKYKDCQFEQIKTTLSQKELHTYIRQITVKIIKGGSWGSGFLIQKQRDLYTVLTNAHVVLSEKKDPQYKIKTPDGKIYMANLKKDINFPHEEDLAVLQFRSPVQNYQIATFGDSSQLQPNDTIITGGFPSASEQANKNGFKFTQGQVWLLLNQPLLRGYQLGYTSKIEKGMSGGPVLNTQGEVIGINGIHAYPLWEKPYVYINGKEPNPALQKKMDEYNWAIPANTIVRLIPELIVMSSTEYKQKKNINECD